VKPVLRDVMGKRKSERKDKGKGKDYRNRVFRIG
jgi:hypothetical protein